MRLFVDFVAGATTAETFFAQTVKFPPLNNGEAIKVYSCSVALQYSTGTTNSRQTNSLALSTPLVTLGARSKLQFSFDDLVACSSMIQGQTSTSDCYETGLYPMAIVRDDPFREETVTVSCILQKSSAGYKCEARVIIDYDVIDVTLVQQLLLDTQGRL